MTSAISVGFLLVGSFFAIPWTRGTYIHYCFVFVANCAYFAVGPRAALLVAFAGAAGVIAQRVRARLSGDGEDPDAIDRAISLAAATAGSVIAIAGTHALRLGLGLGQYPLSFGEPGDLGRFMLSFVALYAMFTASKETLLRLRKPRAGESEEAGGVQTSRSLYVLVGIVGAPMQFAAYAVYSKESPFEWAAVMLWSLLVNTVIADEVTRMRHVGTLMRELAAKERLAAIGEVTARIVHQTRHQLGLIGITVHRIERRIGGLPAEDALTVRGELAKLGEVQDELRRMLTRDLRGETDGAQEPRDPAPPALTYGALVRQVAGRLEGLAAARGVHIALAQIDAADTLVPHAVENMSQALFNVLENAIAAARSEIRVGAVASGSNLVVSIVDDGTGMAPAVLARAMEPFFTTKADGTGMGLPIARAAVAEEGGVLTLANEPGRGLAVEFVVPLDSSTSPVVA